MVTVNDSKITFVWGSCFADHHWNAARSDEMMWRKPQYVLAYNSLRAGTPHPWLDFAWYPGQKSAFWRHYLGGQAVGEVRASDAWEAQVPFRLLKWIPGVETDLGERIVVDTYGYELGVVVVLTVQAFKRAAVGIDAWVERLTDLRREQAFLLDDGGGAREADIEQVMTAIARALRVDCYGGGGSSVSSDGPITIVNILQADGGRPGDALDEAVQRPLHAVTAWPPHWSTAALPPIGACPPFLSQREGNRLPNDALYASGRGLAVWRPGLFARPDPGGRRRRRHTLSCLGHNLSAAAAQAEYLRLVAKAHAAQPKLRERLDVGRMRSIGGRIEALLRGSGTTYRSAAARHLLADPNSRQQVDAMLALAGLAPVDD